MLPRLLFLTSIALSLTAATANSLPRLDVLNQATILLPSPHEVILPCAKCAFSEDPQCSEVIDRDSYLTITFSIENNSLLANQDVIFPASLPMEFSAVRHNGSGHDEDVRLSYALDVRPVPRDLNARLGEVYLLKMKLLDAFGRLASKHVVMIGVTTSDSIAITELTTFPIPDHPHHRHHHPHPDPYASTKNPKSWLLTTIHTLKSTAKECIHVLTHPNPPPSPSPHHHHHVDPTSTPQSETEITPKSDPHRTLPPANTHRHHGHRSHHATWHGHGLHRGFGRLVRPVLLPALLGAAAGVMACVVGFMMGRVVVMVWYCVFGSRGRKEKVMAKGLGRGRGRMVRVPVVLVKDFDEDSDKDGGVSGEKERLLREVVVRDETVGDLV